MSGLVLRLGVLTKLVIIALEKHTPHTKLARVYALIREGRVVTTTGALRGALDLGIHDLRGMCDVILRLSHTDFYKSMTTHQDHRVWQDVYRLHLAQGRWAYIKLTVLEDVLIVSFKEL